MAGDVNLFWNDHDDGGAAEIEVMVAEPRSRRKGLATEALNLLMSYAVTNLVRRGCPPSCPTGPPPPPACLPLQNSRTCRSCRFFFTGRHAVSRQNWAGQPCLPGAVFEAGVSGDGAVAGV